MEKFFYYKALRHVINMVYSLITVIAGNPSFKKTYIKMLEWINTGWINVNMHTANIIAWCWQVYISINFVRDLSKCIMIVTFLNFFYRSSVWPSGNVWDAESYYNVWYKHVPLPAPSTPGLQALCGMQWQVLGLPLWCELLWGLQGMISDCIHNLVHIY